MWRIVGAFLFGAGVVGCVSVDGGPENGGPRPQWGRSHGPPTVPGVEGPYGTPVGLSPHASAYNAAMPRSQVDVNRMMTNSIPMSMVDIGPGGMISPKGVPGLPGGGMPGAAGMPTGMGMPGPGMGLPGMGLPGMPGPGMPGPGMPGPGMGLPGKMSPVSFTGDPNSGVMNANVPPGKAPPGNVVPTQFASTSPTGGMFPAQRTQIRFSSNPPGTMKVHWDTGRDAKAGRYTLETPGSYNFAQAAIYRLKLTHIPGHPGLELYPTLEVVPTGPKTNEFLAHNSVPLVFTEADFKQVVDRNYIVKVVYLPDPQFQDVAGAGPDEIDSRRLEPGQDPIQEALRRGSILLVVRIGNIDQEVPNSPSMIAPPPGMKNPPVFAPSIPGMPGGVQVPMHGGPVLPGFNPPPFAPVPAPQREPGGNEMERKKSSALPPLPPLPSEQPNPGRPVLPFDPAPRPEVASPLKKGFNPPLPDLNLDLPGIDRKDVVITLPAPTPKKDEAAPPIAVAPKADVPLPLLPSVPVSAEPMKVPPRPDAIDLPMIPMPVLPEAKGQLPANISAAPVPGAPQPSLPEFLTGPPNGSIVPVTPTMLQKR